MSSVLSTTLINHKTQTRFGIVLLDVCALFVFWFLCFVFFPNDAHAGTIINAPKGFGLSTGLVGHWTFDGKDMAGTIAYDKSGQWSNGTLTNGPTRAIGKLGQTHHLNKYML